MRTDGARHRKPAGFKRADIPAAKTAPLKHRKDCLDEVFSACNGDGSSDTSLAPDSDVDSRSARVYPIPRGSTSDSASPNQSGSPSSCLAASPADSVTNSALCSANGSPSGRPGVGKGDGAGGSPSVSAGGGSPSGASAGDRAGGGAVVDSAIGQKKGATGGKKKGKRTIAKKKPKAAVKTAEVLELEAFEESMQPEPPVHAVVPETPTPWAYLPSDQGGPGEDRDFSTTAAREALQTMVWDRRHFFLKPDDAMEVESVACLLYTSPSPRD